MDERSISTKDTREKIKRRGRKDRRKRKKQSEIHKKVEEALLATTASSSAVRSGVTAVGGATAATATNITPSPTAILPTDRDKVWPTVVCRRRESREGGSGCWTLDDETALISQLGYLPGNVIAVSAREPDVPALFSAVATAARANTSPQQEQEQATSEPNPKVQEQPNAEGQGKERAGKEREDPRPPRNAPVAIRLYPIVLRKEHVGSKNKGRKRKRHQQASNDITADKKQKRQDGGGDDGNNHNSEDSMMLSEPFPTIYWLTHPLLRTLISKLEVGGLGRQLESRLKEDGDAMESMRRAHLSYGRERYGLLSRDDLELIRSRRWESAFDADKRGVAGIRHFGSVKCLHAHAAHYLSGGSDNVVGKWVMDEVGKLFAVLRRGEDSEGASSTATTDRKEENSNGVDLITN